MSKQKVSLITGLNGFIGKHLSDKLLTEGHKVAEVPRSLLINPMGLEKYIKEINPDYVFHLAAYGNHSQQTDEDETFVTNVFKTYNLLRAVRSVKLDAFVNFSTSSIYGNNAVSVMKESDKPVPETLYATTKIMSEYLANYYRIKYDKRVINVRPFSVYGEGEADFRFIPTVCNSLIEGKDFELYTDPVHDWIYVRDFVDALVAIVNSDYEGEINIGTGEQTTNRKVVEMLGEISKKDPRYKILEGGREYDSTYWCADIDRLKEIWRPSFSLEEGLRQTYEYYKQRSQKKDN